MSRPLKTPACYQDLVDLPEWKVGEIVGGELYASPRPAGDHTFTASALGVELGGPFQRGRNGPGGWWILDEPELHLGADVLVPDLAGWRLSRMPVPEGGPHYTLSPDWICEVVSPSTASLDRVRKLPIYAREGLRNAWLVDPLARTLEVLRLDGGSWRLVATHGGEDLVRAEPFDEVQLELGALWRPAASPTA